MKATLVKISGLSLFVISLLLWISGGARMGFYKEFYVVEKVDEITEIVYPEEVAAFLPGIETLVAGFLIFALSLCLSYFLESKTNVPN